MPPSRPRSAAEGAPPDSAHPRGGAPDAGIRTGPPGQVEPLQVHVIADSTGETAARLSRAAQAQFPDIEFRIVRHPRVSSPEHLLATFEHLRGVHAPCMVLYTLVHAEMRHLVELAWTELDIPCADLMGQALAAIEAATGRHPDEVVRRPVGVEADYFTRISAMEYAIRAELDDIDQTQRRLGAPVIDTTGLALKEAAARIIDLVDRRARRMGTSLRRPAGSVTTTPDDRPRLMIDEPGTNRGSGTAPPTHPHA